jgi:ribonucleoside-diphosphate reductase alpha chain
MSNDLLKYFNGDELAASVWKGKYSTPEEETPSDMHRRMAKEFARVDLEYQKNEPRPEDLSDYGKRRNNLTEDSIYNLFKNFKYVVPQGSIMSVLGSKKISSLSNCFVVGQPYDSYGGIMQKDQQLAQLMKRRGGVGIDISTLRPEGVAVTNSAGSSTGAISFMERYSNTTREVAQNGRRGALMISIDVRHPDVEKFATIKKDLTKVTGANISIQLRDDFMQAVKDNTDYVLRWPCDATPEEASVTKKINAKELWDVIVQSAHATAEPGLMFLDKHWDYSPDTVYPEYKGVTTNPCGEIFMQEYDACRLLAVNFFSFVKNPFTDNADFDLDLLYEVCYEQQRLADDLIDLEAEMVNKIIEKIKSDPEPDYVKRDELYLWQNILDTAISSRRTGCGFTALGDAIAAMGYKYDSDESLNLLDKIMETKFKAELDCSIDLAILRDTFKGYDPDLEWDIAGDDSNGYTIISGKNSFYQMILENMPILAYKMCKYGRRNVNWSTVAPTGSVSILTQTTSGLEPLFSWGYMRRKKVNPGDKSTRVDFVDQNGDSWMEYPVLHPKFKQWVEMDCPVSAEELNRDSLESYFKKSPWYKSTANDINWLKRVAIQSIIQKYTTHSISTTLNLPNDVTVEEVSDIYFESWRLNLKGQTIYRDGCRSGVLVNLDAPKKESFSHHDAPKRPKVLEGMGYTIKHNGKDNIVIVGLLENKPYEVFCVLSHDEILQKSFSCKVVKNRSGSYNLEIEDKMLIEDFTSRMTENEGTLSRMISTALRHGANIKFIVEQLQKSEGELNSFSKLISRVLKKYIPDGESATIKCNECGSKSVVFQEGCMTCQSCGNSKCG